MTAADIIAAHQRRTDYNHPAYGLCHCGFDPEGFDADGKDNPGMGEHVLAVLKAAGWEVVQLPEPTRHTDNTAQWDGMYWSVIRNVGVVISDVAHLQSFDPDEARSLAAALLAAANAAEEAK